MRIAVIGVCAATADVIDAIVRDERFQLDGVFEPAARWREAALGGRAWQRIERATGLSLQAEWEQLLHPSETHPVELVVVALPDGVDPLHDQPSRDDVLRKILQAQLRLCLVQPACASIVAYELDMIGQELPDPILVYEPHLHHPGLEQLAQLAGSASTPPWGATEIIRCERRLGDRSTAAARRQLACDALWLEKLVGDLVTVHGVGRAGEDAQQRVLYSATLQSRQGPSVQWTNSPGEPGARLTMVGDRGSLSLDMTVGQPWRLSFAPLAKLGEQAPEESSAAGLSPFEARSFESWNPAADALERFRRADFPSVAKEDWRRALRSLELAELAQQSVVRGRALPLHRDQVTEVDSFKGVMAAAGCGMLLLTLLVLLAFSLVEGVRFPLARARWNRDQATRTGPSGPERSAESATRRPLWLRLWPVYPFVLFLLLQTLRYVARDAPDRRGPPAKGGGDVDVGPRRTRPE